MTHPLLETSIGDRRLRIVATERSDGDVHPARVEPGSLRVRQVAIAPPARLWAMVDQVHGVDVLDIGAGQTWAPTLGVADVVTTRAIDAPIAIWAADCAPIVLASNDGTLVAAHGGWSGLAAGVIDVAVGAATRHGGSIVAAALGPVIHPCCYEFDASDMRTIPDAVDGRTALGRRALDVPATIAASLARHGVVLDVEGPCTGCDVRWFSHRVRAESGRHAVVASWEAVA